MNLRTLLFLNLLANFYVEYFIEINFSCLELNDVFVSSVLHANLYI